MSTYRRSLLAGLLGFLVLGAIAVWLRPRDATRAAEEPFRPPPTPRPPQNPDGDPLPPGALARLGTTRFRHGDGVKELSYSPDGKLLLSTSPGRPGGARIWNVADGKCRRQFNEGIYSSAALSPDFEAIALGVWDGMVELRNPATGGLLRRIAVPRRTERQGRGEWEEGSPVPPPALVQFPEAASLPTHSAIIPRLRRMDAQRDEKPSPAVGVFPVSSRFQWLAGMLAQPFAEALQPRANVILARFDRRIAAGQIDANAHGLPERRITTISGLNMS